MRALWLIGMLPALVLAQALPPVEPAGKDVPLAGGTMTGGLVTPSLVIADAGAVYIQATTGYMIGKLVPAGTTAWSIQGLAADGGYVTAARVGSLSPFSPTDSFGLFMQGAPLHFSAGKTAEWNGDNSGFIADIKTGGSGAASGPPSATAPALVVRWYGFSVGTGVDPAAAALGTIGPDGGLLWSSTVDRKTWADGFCPWDGGTCWTGQIRDAIEHGEDAGTTGNMSVHFSSAFTAVPTCTCSDTSATLTSCDVTVRTASDATFKTTGSDVVNWICIGAR